MPAMSAGRRPNRSEIGPNSSAAPAETRRYMVTARRIVAESAANSAVMSGIDGRNMSIESGARAASVIRIAVVRCDSARAECRRGGAGGDGLGLCRICCWHEAVIFALEARLIEGPVTAPSDAHGGIASVETITGYCARRTGVNNGHAMISH